MLNPFTVYCSPGFYKFDEEHTFGMNVIDETMVQAYLDSGKWFLNSRDAVDAFIRSQESAEDVASEESGIEDNVMKDEEPEAAVEPDAIYEPVISEEEYNRLRSQDDNETGNNKRRARRSGDKSRDV